MSRPGEWHRYRELVEDLRERVAKLRELILLEQQREDERVALVEVRR